MMDDSTLPFVSVIMPVRNEATTIQRSLSSVFSQDYPADRLEVIIVDGISKDGTKEVIQQLVSEQRRISTSIIDNPKMITPAALNVGIHRAKGEIIIRVDGHCEIKHDYVTHCVEHLQNDAADGVGGAIVTLGDTITAQAIAHATSSFFGVGDALFRLRRNTHDFTDSVPFPAYKRDIFNRFGYYDEEMLCNEDDEFNYRLREMGGRILLARDVRSRYYCRSSIRALWVQYFRFGFWKIRVMQKHPRQLRVRQFAPPVLVLALIGSLLLAFFPFTRILAPAIPLLYIFANLIVSLYTGIRYGWRTLPILPFVFATVHLSYGVGFLAGLVKFADRW
jgi:succinoglycan biosynthesis protein ExoA